jgi:hypothetical protein
LLRHLEVGVEFELSFANKISNVPDVMVFTGFELFSFKLKKTTQIDVLAMTGNDIFIVELKRFTSRIEGSYSSRTWYGYSGNRRYGVYNPIFQNAEHIRSLQAFFRSRGLGVGDFVWHNFVVVPDSCKILADQKYVMGEGRAFELIYFSNRAPVDEIFSSLFSGG